MLRMKTHPVEDQPLSFRNFVKTNSALFLGAMIKKTIAHVKNPSKLNIPPNMDRCGRKPGARLVTTGPIRKARYTRKVIHGYNVQRGQQCTSQHG